MHAFHTALHQATDNGGIVNGIGNRLEGLSEREYGHGEGHTIDTRLPFRVHAYFKADDAGELAGVQISLEQAAQKAGYTVSATTSWQQPAAADVPHEHATMSEALLVGMTPIFSYWSAASMWWLDQGPRCPTDDQAACGSIATFSDLALCDGGPLCPGDQVELVSTTSAPGLGTDPPPRPRNPSRIPGGQGSAAEQERGKGMGQGGRDTAPQGESSSYYSHLQPPLPQPLPAASIASAVGWPISSSAELLKSRTAAHALGALSASRPSTVAATLSTPSATLTATSIQHSTARSTTPADAVSSTPLSGPPAALHKASSHLTASAWSAGATGSGGLAAVFLEAANRAAEAEANDQATALRAQQEAAQATAQANAQVTWLVRQQADVAAAAVKERASLLEQRVTDATAAAQAAAAATQQAVEAEARADERVARAEQVEVELLASEREALQGEAAREVAMEVERQVRARERALLPLLVVLVLAVFACGCVMARLLSSFGLGGPTHMIMKEVGTSHVHRPYCSSLVGLTSGLRSSPGPRSLPTAEPSDEPPTDCDALMDFEAESITSQREGMAWSYIRPARAHAHHAIHGLATPCTTPSPSSAPKQWPSEPPFHTPTLTPVSWGSAAEDII